MSELKFESIFRGVREEFQRLKEEVKSVGKDISTADLQDLNKRLNQLVSINKKLDTTSKQRLKTQQSLSLEYQKRAAAEKRAAKNVRDLAKAEEVLEAITRKQVKSLNDLQVRTNALVTKRRLLDKSTKQGQRQFKKFTQEIVRNTNVLKKNDKQIGRSQRNVGNYASAFKNLLGAAGAGVGIYGVIRLFGGMIKIFKEFEKSNKRLQAILGVTANDMQSLSKQAKTLGSVTAFTASEITGLQTELAKLGFTLPEIEASTEGILSLAAATGTELAEAATLAGSAIRIFGLDASESARVADVLALSTSKSALDMQKLSSALPIVGTTAKQAGLNIEQTTALLGTLADRGIDASTSATSLRNIFLELSKKGLTFNEAMEMINNSTDKSKTSMDLFGKRAATAGVILSETADSTRVLELALNDASGAAKEMADVMLDNLAGDITLAKSAWEGFVLSIESGDGAISIAMRGIIQSISGLLNKLQQLNEFGDNISDKAAKNAKQRVDDFKIFVKDLDEEEQRRRLSIRFYEIERDLLKERNLLNDLRWDKSPEWVQNQIDIVNALEREKKLLISIGKAGFFTTKDTEETEENTEAIEENTKALEDNVKAKQKLTDLQKAQLKAGISPGAVGAGAGGLGAGGQRSLQDNIGETVRNTGEIIKKEATTELTNLQKYFDQLFNGEGSLLERIFGGGEGGQRRAQFVIETWQKTIAVIGNLINVQLDNIQNVLSAQDEQISKTEDLLKTELDRINELKAAGAAFDTTKANLLQAELDREKAARAKTLQEEKALHRKQQNLQVAQAAMDVASGILNAWKTGNWIENIIETAAITALGAFQIGTIKNQKFAEGGIVGGNLHSAGGTMIEAEKDEFVVRRQYAPKSMRLLEMINAGVLNDSNYSKTYMTDMSQTNSYLKNIDVNTQQNKVYDSNGNLKQETKFNTTNFYGAN